jgi:hypothetical protein
VSRLTARDREGDDEPDELEGEELEGEEDEELEDEELEGEEGEEEPEDLAARAPHVPPGPIVTEPPRLAFVDPGASPGAPSSSAPTATVARTVGAWLPFEDERVGYVLVYRAGQGGSYLSRLVRPFPTGPIEQWLASMYGPGRYRLLERGNPPTREYIGSLTVTAAEIPGLTAPAANGNGNGTGHAPTSAPLPAPYGGPMDYRLALVTTGLPLLAGVLGEFAKAMSARPQRSELETILAAAKLLQTPNEERSQLFREGIKLAREMEPPRAEAGPGELFNVRDILSGVGEILKAWRESRPAAPPAATPGGAPPATAASPAGALQATPGETPQGFVERALIMEIRRAVGSADTPDTFVVLVGSWLPSTVISWLETAPEDEILEQLPAQFPAHADYLREPEVQRFLRAALAMLREDAADRASDERGEGAHVREPQGAGV